MRAARVLASTVVALLAVACGAAPIDDDPTSRAVATEDREAPDRLDVELLGGCAGEQLDEPASLGQLLGEAVGWHALSADDPLVLRDADERPSTLGSYPHRLLDLPTGSTLQGDVHTAAFVGSRRTDRWELARQVDADLLLSVRHVEDSDVPLVGTVIAVLGDEAAFVGDCSGELYDGALLGFAEARDRTPAAAARALADGSLAVEDFLSWEGEVEVARQRDPSTGDPRDLHVWDRLAPERRILDIAEAPEAVMARTVGLSVLLDYDRRLVEPGLVLCWQSEVASGGSCWDLASVGPGLFSVQLLPGVDWTLVLRREMADGMVDVAYLERVGASRLEDLVAIGQKADPRFARVTGLDHPAGPTAATVRITDLADRDDVDTVLRARSGDR